MEEAMPLARHACRSRGTRAGRAAILANAKFQRDAVVAVAQAGRLGAVGEDVAVVAQALGAMVFGARHADRQVDLLGQRAPGMAV